MIFRSALAFIVTAVVSMGVVFTSGVPAAIAQEVVKIGAVLPFTGGAASYGQWMREGMDIAIDEINAEWKGEQRLEVIYEDSKTSPKDAVTAAKKLTSVDKVHAVMATLTGVTKALCPIADREKFILTTSATLPGLTECSPYLFRNATNLASEISRLLEFTKGKYTQAGILNVNLEWASWGAEAFAEGFDGKVVARESFDPKATDLRAQLSKIKAAKPDVLLVLAYKTTGVALKQARELGIDAQFIGTLDFELPEVVEIAKEAAEGAIYTKAAFDPAQPANDTMNAYVAEYRKRYNKDPEVYGATHYDMLKILANAAVEAKGDTEAIRKNILGIKNFPGASGVTTFQPNGDVVKPVDLKSIKGGKYVAYEG